MLTCHFLVTRVSLEVHDESGETAVLRGTGTSQQDPPGEVPQLQVQAPAQAHLHHRRQEAAHQRVQADDEVEETGDEAVLHCGVGARRKRQEEQRAAVGPRALSS